MFATVSMRFGPPLRQAQGEALMLSHRSLMRSPKTLMLSLSKYEGKGEDD